MLQNLTKLTDVQVRMRYMMAYGQVKTKINERAKLKSTAKNSWEVYQIKKASAHIRGARKTVKTIIAEMEKRKLL